MQQWKFPLAMVLVVVVLGLSVWWLRRTPAPDMTTVLEANNRGVGMMERFQYDQAVNAFEQVVLLAPDWTPGHINLGIALLNRAGRAQVLKKTEHKEDMPRAIDIFQQVLAGDSRNLHAHFCLGIIHMNEGEIDAARRHFKTVTQLDPRDPHGWFFLGNMFLRTDAEARDYFEKAFALEPNLPGVLDALQWIYRFKGDVKKADETLARMEALRAANWTAAGAIKYSQMGRYAEVIGRTDDPFPFAAGPLPWFERQPPAASLARGTAWAAAADLGKSDAAALLRTVRERFGGTLIVLDYDRDHLPDLLLLGAVWRGGRIGDVLLHNEGGGRFQDVSAETGLDGARFSLGCCAWDFDNDGYPDLVLTTADGPRLFRNIASGTQRRFEDVTKQAGLDSVKSVCLGAALVDLDQDSDLDLVLCQYAAGSKDAAAALKGQREPSGGALLVFRNVGEAPPQTNGKPQPLTPRFQRAELPEFAQDARALVSLAVSDLDLDRDLDLLLLPDQAPPTVVLNDRLLKFRRVELPAKVFPKAAYSGGLVLDSRASGRSDLFLLRRGQAPLFLINQANGGPTAPERWFAEGLTNSPALVQASAVDLDLDGRSDIVGLSAERRPVLLHNDGRRLVHRSGVFGRAADEPADLVAAAAFDCDSDHQPDLVVWSEKTGLAWFKNRGNGNHALPVALNGRRSDKDNVRSNVDGFGVRITAHAGPLITSLEHTTLSAGLGQYRPPLLLGLGRHAQADVVRLRWPDGIWQAELALPAGHLVALREIDRQPISCPILFAWNGRRFCFINDFLGAGSLGEPLPEGGHRQPRPQESMKIEADQLVPKDGRYLLKIAEPMDEVSYVDRLQLIVVDHPAGVRVEPDERFPLGKAPSEDLLAMSPAVFPVRAWTHRGRDVTEALRHRDRDTVDDFARRAWVGFAEEHTVTLDFGDRLAGFTAKDRLVLCLAGWTDYPYPESIWAAHQAGIGGQPPVLERLTADERWTPIPLEVGFPAGLPRMIVLEVTGHLVGPRCRLRLRTNMHVYWDQLFVAPLLARLPASDVSGGPQTTAHCRTYCLEVTSADLSARGCPQEFSPDGRRPTIYDYHRLEAAPVTRLTGRLTRFGDVSELLRETDDRFVIFGPGDDLTVAFAADKVPPLPEGWTRSYVLRTWGYCKDCTPFTATGFTVEPLPFRAMSSFPYPAPETYPRTPRHEEYLHKFQTRVVAP